jgi:hypothetical protein
LTKGSDAPDVTGALPAPFAPCHTGGVRVTQLLFAILISLIVGYAHLRVRTASPSAADPREVAQAVNPGLAYLTQATAEGAATDMQALFPEGYLFTHALVGLSSAELAIDLPPDSPERQPAVVRAWNAWDAIQSDEGRRPFDVGLDPPYGAFYAGWSTWLGALAVRATPPQARSADREERVVAACASLADAWRASPTPFLASYPHQAWPCDSAVAMAALAACERVVGESQRPQLQAVRLAWVAAVGLRADPATGLLPHTADSTTGTPTSRPRGTSVALMARVLPEVDHSLARRHYEGLRSYFLTTRLGVPGVAEHLDGGGYGDVDAGPLVAGVSLSASAVAAGAARRYGDDRLAAALLGVGDALGLPTTWRGQRRYLFGRLPVADGFAIWARTAPRLTEVDPPLIPAAVPTRAQQWTWELGSLLLVALAWIPVMRRRQGGR